MIRFRSRGEAASDAQGCCGLIITKLPETEQHHPAWMAAVEALILVAETDGPTMFVRIGVMRALNHSKPAPKIAPQARASIQHRPMKDLV